MKKHLFLHLSFMGLMGLSTIAYGGWTKYGPEFKSGDPIPNGDCLEMMCPNGCVEDDTNGEYVGYCCPAAGGHNDSCRIAGKDVSACCQSGTCINGKCDCPADKPIWNGTQCCFDVGCGCNVAKVDGCCPGQVKGCDGVCGSGKVDVGCGCGVAPTAEWCCPGQVRGCDGVCGSGKIDTGCGCGVVDRTWEGCCPGQVKGCDGVCGSGKTDTGCGCGVVDRTWEGCCPGQVKGCDGVCGSGKTDTGCGCGITCPTCSGAYEESYSISQPWQYLSTKTYTHTVKGDSGCNYKVEIDAKCVDDGLNIIVNGTNKGGFTHCGYSAPVCQGKPLVLCTKKTLNNIKGGDVIKLILAGNQSGVTEFVGKLKVTPQ